MEESSLYFHGLSSFEGGVDRDIRVSAKHLPAHLDEVRWHFDNGLFFSAKGELAVHLLASRVELQRALHLVWVDQCQLYRMQYDLFILAFWGIKHERDFAALYLPLFDGKLLIGFLPELRLGCRLVALTPRRREPTERGHAQP